MISYEVPIERYGFEQIKLAPSLYLDRRHNNMLILMVHMVKRFMLVTQV